MKQPLLHYQTHGDDNEGTPLVFLHGMLGELQNWNSQSRLFAEEYPVVAVDLRNHGGSPHLDEMSYRSMADDVVHLMEHLGCPEVYLSGHSMGGKVAMHLALFAPELVKKLVVVDIAPVTYPPWHTNILAALLSLPLTELKSRSQFDAYLEKDIPDPFERAFLLKNVVRGESGFTWKCNLQAIARSYLKIAGYPELQGQYNADALFIRGEQSDYVADEYTSDIEHYFPNARIETVEQAGHLPHVQQPKAFYGLLKEFLIN